MDDDMRPGTAKASREAEDEPAHLSCNSTLALLIKKTTITSLNWWSILACTIGDTLILALSHHIQYHHPNLCLIASNIVIESSNKLSQIVVILHYVQPYFCFIRPSPTFCMALEGLGAQMGDTVSFEVLCPGEGLPTTFLHTDEATVIIMFPDRPTQMDGTVSNVFLQTQKIIL